MGASAVNNLFVRLGLLRSPSEPAMPAPGEFMPGEICTSDPDRRVSRAFMGDATPPSTRGLVAPAPRPASTTPPKWTPDQYARFSARVREYLAQNDTLIPHHAAWHEINGPGGTRGGGSGLAFLRMHHEMVVDLTRFISASGRDLDLVPLAEWRPSQPVPQGLAEVDRYSTTPNIATPSWLTVAGGTDAAPLFGYTRLADFKNPDELGRAVASGAPNNLGYHGAGHAAIGGLMWSARAPQDPLFWLWHNHLDGIVTAWTNTANGRAWLATPDGQSWQRTSGHHHHGDANDPVTKRTDELLRLRTSDPAAYEAYLSRSSFAQNDTNAWPADALPLNVTSSQRFDALGFSVQTLATGLSVPSPLTFAPNGDVLFSESNGVQRAFRNGVLAPEPVNGSSPGNPPDGTLITSDRYPQWKGRYARGARGDVRGLQIGDEVVLRGVFGRIGSVAQGPDGYLYLTTSNRDGRGGASSTDDQILRIVPRAAR